MASEGLRISPVLGFGTFALYFLDWSHCTSPLLSGPPPKIVVVAQGSREACEAAKRLMEMDDAKA